MSLTKCPECGTALTKEMINANMCWECVKILDERLLDDDYQEKNYLEEILSEDISLEEMLEQADDQEVFELYNSKIKLHKLTTGYNFEGYKITEYKGLVSGEIVVGTGLASDFKAGFADMFGKKSKAYSDKMKEAKKIASKYMIIESIKKDGDAIIGISYDYLVFSGNMIGISVTGTSVKIEKDDIIL